MRYRSQATNADENSYPASLSPIVIVLSSIYDIITPELLSSGINNSTGNTERPPQVERGDYTSITNTNRGQPLLSGLKALLRKTLPGADVVLVTVGYTLCESYHNLLALEFDIWKSDSLNRNIGDTTEVGDLYVLSLEEYEGLAAAMNLVQLHMKKIWGNGYQNRTITLSTVHNWHSCPVLEELTTSNHDSSNITDSARKGAELEERSIYFHSLEEVTSFYSFLRRERHPSGLLLSVQNPTPNVIKWCGIRDSWGDLLEVPLMVMDGTTWETLGLLDEVSY
jgi:hypothetical protein